MKRIKNFRKWGIYQNNSKEIAEHGFSITILHPDNMEQSYMCSPKDSDMEFDKVEDAEYWIVHYND